MGNPIPILTEELCCYGCGNTAKFVSPLGKLMCSSFPAKCPVNRMKNLLGRISAGKAIAWNKGLTKETSSSVRAYSEKQKGVSKPHKEPRMTPAVRTVLSEKMKIAHAEGRAHNIGKSRWNNEPSWPEKWFMKVIENEFEDKNYKREVPFHRFSLDFVWVDKKLVIEIDGQQHDLDPVQKSRDIRKDSLLNHEGWKVLRIRWIDLMRDSKSWIQIAKDFVHGPVV